MKRYVYATAAFVCAVIALPALAQSVWLSAELYDQVNLVVAANATPQEEHAANVFADYWQRTTGHEPSVSAEPGRRVNVWFGRTGLPEELLVDLELDGLGPDGFILDTLRQPAGESGAAALQTDRHLLVLGGERGVVYAVYQFFDDYMGVRWLAPGAVHVPEHAPPALPQIRLRVVPDFEHRYMNYVEAWDDIEFAEAHKITPIKGYGLLAHTVYELVPPEVYFQDHPDYYSLLDGERRAPAAIDWRDPHERRQYPNLLGQLCFSNPAVARVIATELRKRIEDNPEPKIWSVSQMNWGGVCECSGCVALNEREGSPSGALLTCINRVARALASDFPEHRIETLAHQWSRKPPRQLRPEPNVIIRLSNVECDFARPLTNPKFEENRLFQDAIEAWARLTPNLYIWDYTANQRNFLTPHPNLHVLQPNLRFLKERGAVGVLAQGCPVPGGEFAALRQYILAKCMWDPGVDAGALFTEFIDLYYGPAGSAILEYISLITREITNADRPLTVSGTPIWMDADAVRRAQDIFDQAFEAVGDAEPYKQRVDLAYLPVQYAALVCPPDLRYARYEVTLQRPPCPPLEEFIEMLQGHGMTHIADDQPVEMLADEVGGTTPPRRIDSELRILENEFYLIWVAPALDGSIIRWRDKRQNVELLQGFRTYGRGPGTLQDWTHAPGSKERPVATHYEVASRTLYALRIEALLENGLAVERTMELRPASPEFTVTLTVTNTSDEPIVPNVKIHPEFAIDSSSLPEIWVESGGVWQQVHTARGGSEPIHGAYLEPPDGFRWAYRLPGEGFTMINEFVSHQVGGLFYFYNTSARYPHINLEIIPKDEPLGPGRSRQLRATYTTTRRRPTQF